MTLREEQEKVQKALNAALSGLREDPWLAQRVLTHQKGEKQKPMKKKYLVTAVLAAVLSLVTATGALAVTTDVFSDLLYRVWPWAAQALKPVHLECEDQGIRVEVVSASLEGQDALAVLTMRDMTGDRLDETADLFDSADFNLPNDGSGTCTLLEYDPQTRTAAFALHMHFDGQPQPADKVTLSVIRLLTGKKTCTVDLSPYVQDLETVTGVPMQHTLRGLSGTDPVAEQARQMPVLDTMNAPGIPITDGVTFLGAGIIDGILHVQIKYDDIADTDNHGFLTLRDTDGKQYGFGELPGGIASVSWFREGSSGVTDTDSFQEYLFADYPEDPKQMVLEGEFTTADPAIEGNWRVTFPLELINASGPKRDKQ